MKHVIFFTCNYPNGYFHEAMVKHGFDLNTPFFVDKGQHPVELIELVRGTLKKVDSLYMRSYNEKVLTELRMLLAEGIIDKLDYVEFGADDTIVSRYELSYSKQGFFKHH